MAQSDGEQTRGVLVRLEPSGQAVSDTPTVVLTPTSGAAAIEITLNDSGEPPDVAKADGRWAGVAMTNEESFSIALTVGGERLDGGNVSWETDNNARDLILTLTGDGVVAQASSPDAAMAPNPSGGMAPSTPASQPGGAHPTGAASIPAGGNSIPGASQPNPTGSTAADDGWLWVALGVGAFCLVGGLLLVLRGGGSHGGGPKLDRAPEPPIFGTGTPSLSGGLSVWKTDPHEQDRFVTGLVGALAREHRVLVALSEHAAVPSAFGGPVYVCRESAPKRIEDHLADIEEQPGLPLVVVVVTPRADASTVQALTEMMTPDPGCILVTPEPPPDATVHISVALDNRTAILATPRGTVTLTETRRGYVLQES